MKPPKTDWKKLEGGQDKIEGGREITKSKKKGVKGGKIEKSFLVPYTTHIELPKAEKKFFWFTITLKIKVFYIHNFNRF